MARVAILIDGDNIGAPHSGRIAALGRAEGEVAVHRAYADASNGSGWDAVPGVSLIHAGSGKNAADILLCIDAIEMVHASGVETFVLASSDRDFCHLAARLRLRGARVIGVGEAKAPDGFRAACTRFDCLTSDPWPESPVPVPATPPLPGPSELDRRIRDVIAAHSRKGAGMQIADLNTQMRARYEIRISARPERNWRRYLCNRPSLYDLDPRGPEAHVRFIPEGFKA